MITQTLITDKHPYPGEILYHNSCKGASAGARLSPRGHYNIQPVHEQMKRNKNKSDINKILISFAELLVSNL